MIADDNHLEVTQERIRRFQGILVQLRVTALPQEFPYVASRYIAEIEQMQADVMSFLKRHSSEPTPALPVGR
jgi:hypothetical protein